MKPTSLLAGLRANPSARPARASLRLLFAGVLALAASPALAQQMPLNAMGNDSAQVPAALAGHLLADAMTPADRGRLLSIDVDRMAAAAAAADAIDPQRNRVHSMLQRALALLGTPYRWGGSTPENGFDCSGLVGYVFRNSLGIELPRVSRDMARAGEPVADRQALSAGDLVFFGRRGRVDHVGIYVGEGRFVHAPRTGRDVTVSRMDSGYWSRKFLQARRVDI